MIRAYKFDLTETPKQIFLGKHDNATVWNDGANSVFLSTAIDSTPTEWLRAGESHSLDNFPDPKFFLSCAAALTTTVRIQVWGESTNIIISLLNRILLAILETTSLLNRILLAILGKDGKL